MDSFDGASSALGLTPVLGDSTACDPSPRRGRCSSLSTDEKNAVLERRFSDANRGQKFLVVAENLWHNIVPYLRDIESRTLLALVVDGREAELIEKRRSESKKSSEGKGTSIDKMHEDALSSCDGLTSLRNLKEQMYTKICRKIRREEGIPRPDWKMLKSLKQVCGGTLHIM